ncbi:MAG: hypothetical protein QG620_872, partial [Patescibacteria group bacterium]|nr:hypothetical protein [Patescibacteria group bacterium]
MPKTKTTKAKTIFSLSIILTLAFLVVPLLKEKVIESAKADVTDNVTGWLWGGSEDGNMGGNSGTIDGNDTHTYWTVMNNVDKDGNAIFPNSSFGVSVPETDGLLSGYAWNGSLGWISFEQGDLSGCPSGHGACNARRVGNNIEGWARIMSIKTDLANGNSGNWEGWILLDSVVIDPTTGKITGYGWNGENTDNPAISPNNVANGMGWIDFDAEM